MAQPIQFQFGALAEPFAMQFKKKGIEVDSKRAETWDKLGFSISMLSVHGILAPTESEKARKRLMREIERELVRTKAVIPVKAP